MLDLKKKPQNTTKKSIFHGKIKIVWSEKVNFCEKKNIFLALLTEECAVRSKESCLMGIYFRIFLS